MKILKMLNTGDRIYKNDEEDKGEAYYVEKLRELLKQAISRKTYS